MPRQRNSLQNILPKGERQDNGCLLYTHNRKKNGSSLVSYGDEMMPVHRVVYLLSGKTLPPSFDVHHTCHNKSCIEITHLEVLSRSQHALLSAKDIAQRNQRLRALLSDDPTVELLPIAMTSTTLGALWRCQSCHVPRLSCLRWFISNSRCVWIQGLQEALTRRWSSCPLPGSPSALSRSAVFRPNLA